MSSAPPPVVDPLERLRTLLARGDAEQLRGFLSDFHGADLADLIEALEDDERRAVVRALVVDPALVAEALSEMELEEHPEASLAGLDPAQIAAVVAELSDDDAADLIGELSPREQARVLASLPLREAGEIRDLLRYDDESAGGIMTTELVAIPEAMSAAQAIEEVRRQAREVEEFYGVFVVDGSGILRGTLPLQALVIAPPDQQVEQLVEPIVATVTPEMDQEDVGRILTRYNLAAVAVVDAAGHLLGRITFDDVLDILEAETTEDILKFGGVSEEEELRGSWREAVRSRLPWLYINLLTAFAAAGVVLFFAGTVDRLPILAVWMPVIAGMGGNAGTQALAVTVRRLALTPELGKRHWEVVGKELLVGATNGLATGLVTAAVATAIAAATGEPLLLGLVVLLAMWFNLAVAGFAGAFVPSVLARLDVDPAVASSIFVTTFTDMVGFFLLLGLAAWLII